MRRDGRRPAGVKASGGIRTTAAPPFELLEPAPPTSGFVRYRAVLDGLSPYFQSGMTFGSTSSRKGLVGQVVVHDPAA